MPYLSRHDQIGYCNNYHIFNRAGFGRNLFNAPCDYEYFIKLLRLYSNNHNFVIYHWVLMSDHYHLLIKMENSDEISSIMAGLARAYVHYYHRKYRTYGHLWQSRFKSQAIHKDKYILSCGRYIERNPVRAALVGYAFEYPYSSARYYILGERDGLTSQNPLFKIFGFQLSYRRQRYKIFLNMTDFKEDNLLDGLEFPQGLPSLRRRFGFGYDCFRSGPESA